MDCNVCVRACAPGNHFYGTVPRAFAKLTKVATLELHGQDALPDGVHAVYALRGCVPADVGLAAKCDEGIGPSLFSQTAHT